MSDSSSTDEIDAIRQKKLEEMQSKATGDTAESPAEPIHLESDAQFDELVDAHDVVLVDFYADWCGPCKMLEPTVKELAAEGKATVVKVDVDQHQTLAQSNGVQGIPTLLLYADGEQVKRLVGVQDKATLSSLIEQVA
ncbi:MULTISPECIES: thioredoxin [unclassified Haladaptatus]|uniref:thioredoxin n=1 Tax=unclassified Haladaptatus TaxID=2622732 RepID=UPI0023E8D57B|nr:MULTISPECIES: thioredoxin [unclassified Haladaptatus]